MSFRVRLFLFFVIIVVVPMIAVALVLFSLTKDSETGKADAQIAQGLRLAFAEYSDGRAEAKAPLGRIARDALLGDALATGRAAQVRARVRALARAERVDAAAAYDERGREIAYAGDRTAIAPAVARPSTESGRALGMIAVSTTPAAEFATQVARRGALEVRVVRGDRVLASTIPGDRGPPKVQSGEVEIGGDMYRGRFATIDEAVGPPVYVGIFVPGDAIHSAVHDSRVLIGAILAAFLLLALLSSIVVVRALQRQIDQFLRAARRLAAGDFSRPVPVEGGDEFAALGTEFNRMSEQLESKIAEVQRKRNELEDTIRRVGEAFASGLDREGIVNLAVRTAVDACEADVGRAVPIDKRRLRAVHVGDHAPDLIAALEAAERAAFDVRAAAGQDLLGYLESTDEDSPPPARPVPAEVDDVYALAVPLVARVGRSRAIEHVGVITIARRGVPFDESQVELFAYLAGQAAVSIENADLHETVQRQAVTDELTGLSNLRHFDDALTGEIERSRRFGQGVGLVMLDIDDFKKVNDTYGHQQGDIVLSKVARVLRELSRDIDEPARYGGEEMAVVLPQTDLEGAELAAERMRQAIESLQIERIDGEGTLGVTASFGVASLPQCAKDKDSLIAEADAALYRAKRAGKNTVRRGDAVAAES
jgi:diguanylate cyclase (GGDEF)-like protein